MHKSFISKTIVSLVLVLFLISMNIPLVQAASDNISVENNTQKKITKISSQEEFEAIANNMFGDYELTKDLVFSSDYTPIGGIDDEEQFRGTLNGNGHTITLNINSDNEYTGLFASISGATIMNLKIKGNVNGTSSVGALTGFSWDSEISNITNYASVNGDSFVGGIAGWIMFGDLSNCTNLGEITGTSNAIGGITGMASSGGFIHDCVNKGNISSTRETKDCYDFCFVGGIAGQLRAAIVYNSVNYGDIFGGASGVGGITGDASSNPDDETEYYGSVFNCYNEGTIMGHAFVGGINGGNTHGWIENCVNTGKVTSVCTDEPKYCVGPISGHKINFNTNYDEGIKKYNYYLKNSAFSYNGKDYGNNTSTFTSAYGKLGTAIKINKKKYTTPYSVLNAWVTENQSTVYDVTIHYVTGEPYTKTLEFADWTVQNGKFVLNISGNELSKYKVTYVLNGGKNNAKNKSNYVSTKSVKLNNPTKKGYTFAGWYTDKALTKKINSIPKGNLSPVKVYAKWIKK